MGFSFSITFHNNLSEIFIGSIFKINADPPTWSKPPLSLVYFNNQYLPNCPHCSHHWSPLSILNMCLSSAQNPPVASHITQRKKQQILQIACRRSNMICSCCLSRLIHCQPLPCLHVPVILVSLMFLEHAEPLFLQAFAWAIISSYNTCLPELW